MKIFYNSKLAKFLTFVKNVETMMLFGFVITEGSSLTESDKVHEETHVFQYFDCAIAGLFVAGILAIIFGNAMGWWSFMLLLIPLLAFYLLYILEYLYWVIRGKGWNNAYDCISFERQAYWRDKIVGSTIRPYVPYSWWRKNFGVN